MKEKFLAFLKNEVKGIKPLDAAWLAVSSAVILGLSIYWKDSAISLVAALTGVWCVVLTGFGKRSAFIFGTVNVVFYAMVAWQAKYYGEVMLNILYYLPMEFVGWFAWKKHINAETGSVTKQRLPLKSSVVLYAITAVAVVAYGFVLRAIGGALPFFDSLSTVISVVAQVLSIKRLMEQWVLWIVVDAVTVVMWAVNFAKGGESVATLAMWSVYLINGVLMYIRWHKEAKAGEIALSAKEGEQREI